MPFTELGSQNGDSPKTPTLRAYWRSKEGQKIPTTHPVKIVFRPNKAPNWSFVTESNFRVSVLEDNPLHSAITNHMDEWANESMGLFIEITDGAKGQWKLVASDTTGMDWEEMTWGFKVESTFTKKPDRRKKGTTEESSQSEQTTP